MTAEHTDLKLKNGSPATLSLGCLGFLVCWLAFRCGVVPVPKDVYWIAVVLSFACFLAAVSALRGERFSVRLLSLDFPHAVLLLTMLASAWLSLNGEAARSAVWMFVCCYAVFRLSLYLSDNPVFGRCLLAMVLATAAVVAAYALIQYVFYLPAMRAVFREDPEEMIGMLGLPHSAIGELKGRLDARRAYSTFVLPNTLAGYLLLASPCVAAPLFLAWSRRRSGGSTTGTRLRHGWLLAVCALLLLCFWLTRSKGAFVCAAVTGVIAVCYSLRSKAGRFAPYGAAVLVLVVVLLLVAHPKLRDYAGSFRVRSGYWTAAVNIASDYPYLGTGPGTFGDYYPMYMAPGDQETRMAHNCLLQMWAEAGSVAVAAFIWLWAIFWLKVISPSADGTERGTENVGDVADQETGLREALGSPPLAVLVGAGVFFAMDVFRLRSFYPLAHRSVLWLRRGYPVLCLLLFAVWAGTFVAVFRTLGGERRVARTGSGTLRIAGFGIAGFLIHSLGDFDLWVPGISVTAWLLMGLVLATCIRGRKALIDIAVTPRVRLAGLAASGLLVVLVVAVVVRPLRAGLELEAAGDSIKSANLRSKDGPDEAIRLLDDALRRLDASASFAPGERVHYRLATTYLSLHALGRKQVDGVDVLELAAANAELALKFNPLGSEARGLRARLFRMAGRIEEEILERRELVRLHPTLPEMHLELARAIRRQQGRLTREVVEEYEEALRLDVAQYSQRTRLSSEQREEAESAVDAMKEATGGR